MNTYKGRYSLNWGREYFLTKNIHTVNSSTVQDLENALLPLFGTIPEATKSCSSPTVDTSKGPRSRTSLHSTQSTKCVGGTDRNETVFTDCVGYYSNLHPDGDRAGVDLRLRLCCLLAEWRQVNWCGYQVHLRYSQWPVWFFVSTRLRVDSLCYVCALLVSGPFNLITTILHIYCASSFSYAFISCLCILKYIQPLWQDVANSCDIICPIYGPCFCGDEHVEGGDKRCKGPCWASSG